MSNNKRNCIQVSNFRSVTKSNDVTSRDYKIFLEQLNKCTNKFKKQFSK